MTPTAVTIIVMLLLALLLLATLLQTVLTKYENLDRAATQVYLATRWRSTTPRLSEHVEAQMWQNLRDALLLEPGTATALGVGDPNA
jgi:hypothetical protein